MAFVLDLLCSFVGSLTNPANITNTIKMKKMQKVKSAKPQEKLNLLRPQDEKDIFNRLMHFLLDTSLV